MSSTLALLAAVDRLYEAVVTEPEAWGAQAFSDWAEEVASGGVTKVQARAVRRCLRAAERLRDFWQGDRAAVVADGWRTRVDVALGARAWRPALELAQAGLEDDPSPELFAEVQERFRVVNSRPWLEGIDYETWWARRGTV
jgi:hypothetical protein